MQILNAKNTLTTLDLQFVQVDDNDMTNLRELKAKIIYDDSPEGNVCSSRLQLDFGFNVLDVSYSLISQLRESIDMAKVFTFELDEEKLLTRWSAEELYNHLVEIISDRKISLTILNKSLTQKT